MFIFFCDVKWEVHQSKEWNNKTRRESVSLDRCRLFVFVVVHFSEATQEHLENKPDKEGGTGKHEVSLSHVVFPKFLVNDNIVIVAFCFDGLEIVHNHVFRIYVSWNVPMSRVYLITQRVSTESMRISTITTNTIHQKVV